jgi:prevent-host-death family protein
MKTIAASDLKSDVNAALGLAQKERVLITRAGKPCAVIIGIENYDDEDFQLAQSHEFWRLIESRRREGKSIPFTEVEARIMRRSARSSSGNATRSRSRSGRRRGNTQ